MNNNKVSKAWNYKQELARMMAEYPNGVTREPLFPESKTQRNRARRSKTNP